MADSIVPVSTLITGLTPDRQQRRDQRQEADGAKAVAAQAEDNKAEAPAAAPPPADEPPVEAETLFSASVLGQRMRSLAGDLTALKLKREQEWSPPESALRLKDKSI